MSRYLHYGLPGLLFMCLLACSIGESTAVTPDTVRIDYEVVIRAGSGDAEVSVTVHQSEGEIRLFEFSPTAQVSPRADSDTLDVDEQHWEWRPPPTGGTLSFTAPLNHARVGGSVDGLINNQWGIFRGDDLVPPARVRVLAGTEPQHRLMVNTPDGWSVATPYGRGSEKWLPVRHDNRLFDRPTGWFIVGEYGLRSESIADGRVWVAAPRDQGARRMDVVAFLHWVMPVLTDVFGRFPDPLLIVSAGDPFFRGGLAAPNSYFIHSERPLISENGTSSYAHELVHLLLPPAIDLDADWITEGLAEYYSVEALRRSGSVSEKRYLQTHEALAAWGSDITTLDKGSSTGASTARAVAFFRTLHSELQAMQPPHSLDEVAARLTSVEHLSMDSLVNAIEETAGALPAKVVRELEFLTDFKSSSANSR